MSPSFKHPRCTQLFKHLFLYFRQNNSQKNKLQVSEEILKTFIPCFSNLKIENCALLLFDKSIGYVPWYLNTAQSRFQLLK